MVSLSTAVVSDDGEERPFSNSMATLPEAMISTGRIHERSKTTERHSNTYLKGEAQTP